MMTTLGKAKKKSNRNLWEQWTNDSGYCDDAQCTHLFFMLDMYHRNSSCHPLWVSNHMLCWLELLPFPWVKLLASLLPRPLHFGWTVRPLLSPAAEFSGITLSPNQITRPSVDSRESVVCCDRNKSTTDTPSTPASQ